MKRRPDLRTIEMEVINIEDEAVRDALLDLLKILKAQQDSITWIMSYAEGVR